MPIKNEMPKPARASGIKENNLNGNDTKSASKLFAEADRVIATFPFIMTRERKCEAKRQVLSIFLAALDAGRQERLV